MSTGDVFDAADKGLAIVRQDQAVERREPTIMEIIQDTARNPSLEAVAVIERLVALQERQEANKSRREFIEALTGAQSEIPQIGKHAPGQSGKFASLEDIDAILKPIMTKYGFALSFDEKMAANDHREHIAILSHRGGHSESRSITLPVDKGGNKNGVQAVGSSASYAQRYLKKKHFDIVEKGEDTDGRPAEKITEDEAKDLNIALNDFAQDSGAKTAADFSKFRDRFLKHFKISTLPELLKSQHSEALQMLKRKQAQP